MSNHKAQTVFFGTPELAVWALEAMEQEGLVPDLIITAPDKPAGRGRKLTPPPVKQWALQKNIPVLQPAKLNDDLLAELAAHTAPDPLMLLFAYGKIVPKSLLSFSRFGILNLHPSLLPKLRGPSPIRSAILHDQKDAVGVSIILLDEKMDHGPILAQEKITPKQWPIPGRLLDQALARAGGKLLAETACQWRSGSITPIPQEHDKATYCHFFKKSDAEINLSDDPLLNYRKICAFDGWPGAFFYQHGTRLKITAAHLKDGKLVIDRVIPEGKKEQPYTQWLANHCS